MIVILIKLDSPGTVFFRQKRIGQHLRPFRLVKFRSMSVSSAVVLSEFDPGDHRRVTRVGSFLRKTKLDEFPELINVVNGRMSIVGPRPEVPQYVLEYLEDFKEVLTIKPGISDFASIKYRDEEAILAGQSNPVAHYLNVVLPDKLYLAKQYIASVSFETDIRIIMDTIKGVVKGNPRDKGWRR